MRRFVSLFLTGVMLACFSPGHAQTYKLAVVGVEEGTKGFRAATRLLDIIGEKLSVTIELKSFPAKRAAHEFKNGTIDGEMSRVIEYETSTPGIVRVTEPITEMPYFAWAKSADFEVKGWKSLLPYKVVYILGFKMVEVNLKPIHNNLQAVPSAENALNMVAAGRADIYVDSPLSVYSSMPPEQLKALGVRNLKPPVTVLRTYTFFAKKHAVFAQQYNNALIELKKDGTYMKILTQTP